MRRALGAGYFVRVFFIGTSDPRINAARVAGRVMEGGHTVPLEKIVSRYSKSMANLAVAIDRSGRHEDQGIAARAVPDGGMTSRTGAVARTTFRF